MRIFYCNMNCNKETLDLYIDGFDLLVPCTRRYKNTKEEKEWKRFAYVRLIQLTGSIY